MKTFQKQRKKNAYVQINGEKDEKGGNVWYIFNTTSILNFKQKKQ